MGRNLSAIFNRQRQHNPEEDTGLYRWGKVPYKKDDMRMLETLLKSARNRKPTRDGRKITGGGGFTDGTGTGKSRSCTFKMSYNDTMAAHDRYLNVYMPQAEKNEVVDKPRLFGTDEDAYEAHKTDRHFKCVISPDTNDINKEVLAHEFIKRLENLTGYKLYWRACIHTDKPHHHLHLCINGKDKNGREVYFPKEMIKRTMREMLSYVCTQMAGERTKEEIEAARKNQLTANRWTELDAKLHVFSGAVSYKNLNPELRKRLLHLATIGLAEKMGNGQYTLKSDWKEVLTASGRYNTYLEEYLKPNAIPLELYAGGGIAGKVEHVITFDKDESWNDALIVRTNDNHRVYVPVWQLKKTSLMDKEIWISKGTRALSRQIRDRDIHVASAMQRQKKTASNEAYKE